LGEKSEILIIAGDFGALLGIAGVLKRKGRLRGESWQLQQQDGSTTDIFPTKNKWPAVR
jgi:hypothetical protein